MPEEAITDVLKRASLFDFEKRIPSFAAKPAPPPPEGTYYDTQIVGVEFTRKEDAAKFIALMEGINAR